MSIEIKRIYAPTQRDDGARVLVDRLWPRGISKERAALEGWMKDVAPSPRLREWFGHEADKMAVFATDYRKELATDPDKRQDIKKLLEMSHSGKVTLLYGARDPDINHAVVLKQYLEEQGG